MDEAFKEKWRESDVIVGRYRIVEILGQGGMGTVYLSEDLKLKGKRWAIKQTEHSLKHPDALADDSLILMQLSHPFLPTIIDHFVADDGNSYIVMEYIKGQTLQQLFEANNFEIDVELVIHYCLQLCDLLHYLHCFEPAPIIYRDLKPDNIMINEHDLISLIDFGIAREYKIGQLADTIAMGTIGFAAPEQFGAQQTDHRTDVYNLGALMYYLLSKGQYYYASRLPLTDLNKDISEQLERVIMRLLQARPEDRYQNVNEVKKELEACLMLEKTKVKEHQPPFTIVAPQMYKKLIVIGSLYPNAGSTFTAIAMARLLNHMGIGNALLEYPTISPDLHYMLYGAWTMPKDYVYLVDDLKGGQGRTKGYRKEWRTELSTWYPLNPEQRVQAWPAAMNYKLLYATQCPMTIIDVSTAWFDKGVEAICAEADEILIVADARPEQFNHEHTQQVINRACEWREGGRSVQFIANRHIASRGSKQWLRSFPWEPICRLPNISYEHMMQAIWREKLVQDDPRIREQMKLSMSSLMKQLDLHQHIK